MKNAVKYFVIVLLVIFVVCLYALKMAEMGMSAKNTIIFIVLFFTVLVIGTGISKFASRKMRKSMEDELKSPED